MGSRRLILLDTHVWIWLNAASDLVPRRLRDALKGEELAVSAISLWEVMMLLDKGRMRAPVPGDRLIRDWLAGNKTDVMDVTGEIAVLSRTLQFHHEDPADRMIGATAYAHQLRLATVDSRLIGLDWLKTV